MNNTKFLKQLTNKDWIIDSTPLITTSIPIDPLAKKRIDKAPKEFNDFICSFSECTSKEETIWILSYQDYQNGYDVAHPWNKYENESIEYSDESMHDDIHTFWENHIPFVMSVSGAYSYIAICINKENYGKIYQGFEPEYEEVTLIASNLSDFFEKFTQSLITF